MTQETGLEYLEKIDNENDITKKMNLFRELIRESGYDPKITECAVHCLCTLHPEYNSSNKALLVVSDYDMTNGNTKKINVIDKNFDVDSIEIRVFFDNDFEIADEEYKYVFVSTDLTAEIIDKIIDNFEDEEVKLISDSCYFEVKSSVVAF